MIKSTLAAILIAAHFAILIYTAALTTDNNINAQSKQAVDIKNTVWVTRIEDEVGDMIMILHFKANGTVGSTILSEGAAFIEFINEYEFDKETQTGIVYYPTKAYYLDLVEEFGIERISKETPRMYGKLYLIGEQLQYNDKILEKTSLKIAEMMCYLFVTLNRIE